jgi:hypothetical protein
MVLAGGSFLRRQQKRKPALPRVPMQNRALRDKATRGNQTTVKTAHALAMTSRPTTLLKGIRNLSVVALRNESPTFRAMATAFNYRV